ncbi:BgTH12-01060 [Blumeria graminis f. sp. triticale]|uniref:BgTH12-01060 n=1 Tax=Blumeria graminis f. sp. triticale TaxID=1689686 RepID=A0A9W4D664_BLUGR|nr:BgTH12-01060 [Blumeria graminis f. sp. triticale]
MDIIAVHTLTQQEEQDEEHAEDEDGEAAEPPSSINRALNGLKRLLGFKEHGPDANTMELTILMCMEISLQQQAKLNRSRGTLKSSFK